MKRLSVLWVVLVGLVTYAWAGDLADQEMDAFLKEKNETQARFELEKTGRTKTSGEVDNKTRDKVYTPGLAIEKATVAAMPEVVVPDPVGEYLFSGNADDSSGHANHGEVSGAQLTEDRSSQPESAYIFYDRDHRIKIPRTGANTFSDGSFTVSFWVKTKDDGSTMKGLVTNKGGVVNFWGFFLNSNGDLTFFIKNQEGQPALINTPINDWKWHHVTGVRNADDNTLSLYVDGTLIQTREGVVGSVDSGNRIWVGDGQNRIFVGRLDDIRLWNKALDSRQLAKLHENGPVTPLFQTPTLTAMLPGMPAPMARYLCDGNAEDSSGNGNDGIVTGAELVEDRAGNPDSAYLFYDRPHRIKIPLTDKNTFTNGSFTASFWVKANKTPNAMVHLLSNEVSGDPFWGFHYNGEGKVSFFLANQEGDHALITSPMGVDAWHHVMGRRNAENNTMSLFVDGALVQTRSGVTGNVNSLGPIYAGDHKNRLFNGRMDEILLWDRALPDTKMAEYYETTRNLPQTVSYSADDDNIEEPVGLYHFDGNSVDASPQGNDAQVNAARLTQDRSGNPNSAYSFYDRDNRIKVPLIAANIFSKGSFSVSLWVKINETGGGAQKGLVTNEGTPAQRWGLFYSSDVGLVFSCNDKEGKHGFITHPIDLETWYHVVGVRDATAKQLRLYVDDQLIGSKAYSGSDLDSGGAIFIGDGKNMIFRGCIDEVTLWRRALAHEEITQAHAMDLHPSTAIPLDKKPVIKEKPMNLNHKIPKKI
ncbi:hypothetical protein JCM14469_42870 [Desulfatiferula olefinivorans]